MYIRTRTGRFGSFFFLRRTLSRFLSWRLNEHRRQNRPALGDDKRRVFCNPFPLAKNVIWFIDFFFYLYFFSRTNNAVLGRITRGVNCFSKNGYGPAWESVAAVTDGRPRCATDAVGSRRVRLKTVVFLVNVVRRGVKFLFFVLRVFRD